MNNSDSSIFFIILFKDYHTIVSYKFPNQIANGVDFFYYNQFILSLRCGGKTILISNVHMYN